MIDPMHISTALAEMLSVNTLGARSRFALSTAVDAAATEGIAGVLVVRFPPRSKDRPECQFTIGNVDLIARWGESA